MADGEQPTASRADALAGAILDLEAERAASATDEAPPDDVLPGVGGRDMSIREALATGGRTTFVILAVLSAVAGLEIGTLGTLGPDIRESLGMSEGALVFVTAASSSFLVLGALPMGWFADRFRRGRVIGIANMAFAALLAACGAAANAFTLFLPRLGVGLTRSSEYTVQGSLMADQYPIETRGRVTASMGMITRVATTVSPLFIGALAALIGGPNAWRIVFVVVAIPIAVVGFLAFRLPEPPRGQYEKKDVLGQVIEDEDPLPISVEAAFARLRQVRTFRGVMVAFASLGFGIFTVPVLANTFLKNEYGLGPFGRGAIGTIGGVGVLLSLPFVGRYYDRLYRQDPAKALRLLGIIVLPSAILTPVQYFMPNAVAWGFVGLPTVVLQSAAFGMIGPLLSAVVPYRLRGMGAAYGSLYIFFVGAAGGAVIAAWLTDAYSARVAVITIAVPSSLVGGAMIMRGAGFIRGDLALITAEIREELDEHERRTATPDLIPALQVQHVDFAYGPVQILFDVSFEVRKGEVLALLGTNGAGKSTILRVIAGLGTPSRGVVRMAGRSVTFVSPEMRSKLGIHMLPGGKGTFNELTIADNLDLSTYHLRKDPAARTAAIERTFELFPELAGRRGERASALSGGQQQMLALAQVLANDPAVLIIDELSLGLAPIMVTRLVEVIETLKARGVTMIVVEQSLNIALAIADRAVFLEKGHVRFEGPVAELADRDDLARAVFLGAEGG